MYLAAYMVVGFLIAAAYAWAWLDYVWPAT